MNGGASDADGVYGGASGRDDWCGPRQRGVGLLRGDGGPL